MENDEKVKLLQKLIQINTVNGNEEDEANYIKRVLEAHHISCKLVSFAPNRTNLIAEIGNDKGPVLALAGHLDTVDPSEMWTPEERDAFLNEMEEAPILMGSYTEVSFG